jgi:hypothetical protein
MTRWIGFVTLPVAASVFSAPCGDAQSSLTRPAFEVASVKVDTGCIGDHQDEKFSPDRVKNQRASRRDRLSERPLILPPAGDYFTAGSPLSAQPSPSAAARLST